MNHCDIFMLPHELAFKFVTKSVIFLLLKTASVNFLVLNVQSPHTCKFFEWIDGDGKEELYMELALAEHKLEEALKKNKKLQAKLGVERKNVYFFKCVVGVCCAMTVFVGLLFVFYYMVGCKC